MRVKAFKTFLQEPCSKLDTLAVFRNSKNDVHAFTPHSRPYPYKHFFRSLRSFRTGRDIDTNLSAKARSIHSVIGKTKRHSIINIISCLAGDRLFSKSNIDEMLRIKKAKIDAEKEVQTIAKNFRNGTFNEEQFRIGLANIDDKIRIEITKIYAAKLPFQTALFFQDFGIKDEKVRIELARICAENGADGLAKT